jgi:hypothetical protein
LINGDLVRIPQGAVIMLHGQVTSPLTIATHPRMGIVLETRNTDKELVKILLDDQVYLVEKRLVQLVG